VTADSPPAASQTSLSDAADRLRASARWLVASFGAIAAVAFAGVSFSSLGSLTFSTPDYRLTVALAGAAVAITGIAFALVKAMRLSAASTTTINDLQPRPDGADAAFERAVREAENDPALSLWDGDLQRFRCDYDEAYRRFLDEAVAFADDPHPEPDRSDLDKADFRLRVLTNVLSRTLETVSFLRLQYAFERSARPIVLALVAASAGATAFAWATTGV
jgi:hypothetical protein